MVDGLFSKLLDVFEYFGDLIVGDMSQTVLFLDFDPID